MNRVTYSLLLAVLLVAGGWVYMKNSDKAPVTNAAADGGVYVWYNADAPLAADCTPVYNSNICTVQTSGTYANDHCSGPNTLVESFGDNGCKVLRTATYVCDAYCQSKGYNTGQCDENVGPIACWTGGPTAFWGAKCACSN